MIIGDAWQAWVNKQAEWWNLSPDERHEISRAYFEGYRRGEEWQTE